MPMSVNLEAKVESKMETHKIDSSFEKSNLFHISYI